MSAKKLAVALCGAALTLHPVAAGAHARAGDRVFPATLAIDDPGVSDELTLPQISTFREKDDGGPAQRVTEYSAEYSKRITDKFALSVETAYIDPAHDDSGFDNLGLGAKYQFLTDADHELILAAGLDWDIGDTGGVGEKNSALTPGLFIGKGFGDLPDSADWLKPFAVTGAAGLEIPVNGDDKSLSWGATLQYSLPYLQQHVKDVGLPKPFANIIPVVEFAFETPVDGGGRTTGTVNPGFIWMGQDMQFGLEAVLPATHASGSGVGVTAQLHFFFDDMFPRSLGRPLFGGK